MSKTEKKRLWVAEGPSIRVGVRLIAGAFEQELSDVELQQRSTVLESRLLYIVRLSDYADRLFVDSEDMTVKLGGEELAAERTFEEAGVEEGATLVVVLDALPQAVAEKRKAARALNNKSLRAALKLWLDPSTREQVVAKYGAIGDWDVSRVTSMQCLLGNQSELNEDLSRWDTSSVERTHSIAPYLYYGTPLPRGWRTKKEGSAVRFVWSTCTTGGRRWD